MNILIDIGHPGHVHLFKNFIFQIKSKNHKVVVTVRNIPAAINLLSHYKIDYINIGKKSNSFIGKGLRQVEYNLELAKIVRKEEIDLALGTSITIAQITPFSKIKSLLFDDDDDVIEPLFVKFGHTFATHILTPGAIKRKAISAIYYNGYHELAYLHPNHFVPDISVLSELGIKENEPFFILRFVAFQGHHDIGMSGISLENKISLVKYLENYGKVFITAEKEIEPELISYKISISPAKIHSLMYYAFMFLGDSQTMTSEAAVLGTPALKCNTFAGKLSVPNELEKKYHLCYAYKPEQFNEFMGNAIRLINSHNIKDDWRKRRDSMLKEKIDVTAFMVWFVENYPESARIMRENPDYQYRFK